MTPAGVPRRVRPMAKVLLVVLVLAFGGLLVLGLVRGRRGR
jgi:hypothetical protein